MLCVRVWETRRGGADTVGADASPTVVDLDHVFEALSASRRRYLCYALRQSPEWTLPDLATTVAAWETDSPEHAVTSQQRDDVYVALYHTHVPKLVAHGIVTFDAENETIAPGERAALAMAALDAIAANLDLTLDARASDDSDG